MTPEKTKSNERERTEESVKLLIKLRVKLLSDDISTARQAALNLSWKQEDGLAILKEALFGKAVVHALAGQTETQGVWWSHCMHGLGK